MIPRTLLSLSLFLATFATSPLLATSWSSQLLYYVKAHYSAQAYGKQVTSVMAHAGVLTQDGPAWAGAQEKLYWSDVQDIFLEQQGDHFFGQFVLEGYDSKFGPYVRYPVIQYWVTFTDGSRAISEVYPVTIVKSETVSDSSLFRLKKLEWDEAFERTPDSSATFAEELIYATVN